jgi:hypothetical protein
VVAELTVAEPSVAAVRETRRVKTLVARVLVVRQLLCQFRRQESRPLLRLRELRRRLRGLVTAVLPVITVLRLRLPPVKTVAAVVVVDAAVVAACE